MPAGLRDRLRLAWRIVCGDAIATTQRVTVDHDWLAQRITTAFVQHKNSDVCMDVTCPRCGHGGHIDAGFCYYLRCGQCGAALEVGHYLPVRVAGEADTPDAPWYDILHTDADACRTLLADDETHGVH